MEEHIKKYLDTVSSVVKVEPHQQLLTTFLGKMIDLYTVMTYHFADAMAEVDRVAAVSYTHLSDIGDILAATDCVFVPSEEGLSLVAMEAMSAKRQVVTMNSSGAYEPVSYTHLFLMRQSLSSVNSV